MAIFGIYVRFLGCNWFLGTPCFGMFAHMMENPPFLLDEVDEFTCGPIEFQHIPGTRKPTIFVVVVSKVVSAHLWNTPPNLYQQAIKGFLS